MGRDNIEPFAFQIITQQFDHGRFVFNNQYLHYSNYLDQPSFGSIMVTLVLSPFGRGSFGMSPVT